MSSPKAGNRVLFHPDNVTVHAMPDEPLRTAALRAGIGITSSCGGNARCSTCRCLVLKGLECCTPRTEKEKRIAEAMGFSEHVRLACQTRVTGDVEVRRLVLDHRDLELTSMLIGRTRPGLVGIEKEVIMVFADIRDFTAFSEDLVPYDVVHCLNRYFHVMNDIITEAGGHIDNYIGDGFLALFDITAGAPERAVRAIKAGLDMLEAVSGNVGPYMERFFRKSFRIGIGMHVGLVVAGSVGARENHRVTVIGDAVNFASRIESANKQMGTSFLISDDLYRLVEGSVTTGKEARVHVRGKTGERLLHEIVGLA